MEKEGRREKNEILVLTPFAFEMLNCTNVKILSTEPKVLYLSFALIDYDYRRDDRLKILYKNNARNVNYFTKKFINC